MKWIASVGFVVAMVLPAHGAGEMERGEAALVYAEEQSANTAALHKYTWKEKLEFSVGGEIKVVKTSLVRVGNGGRMQKTELSLESHFKKKRGLRGHQQKKDMAETKEMWQEIASLVQSYTHRTAGEMVDFFQAAVIRKGIGLMEGTMKVTGADVLRKDDGLRIWVDGETHLPVRMEIHTYILRKKDDRWMVDGTIEFGTLADGTVYPARSIVNLPVENMELTIETFDHALAARASGE